MKEKKTLEEQLYVAGIVAGIASVIFLAFYLVVLFPILKSTQCVFYHLTGYFCPGCGGTRAVIFLLQGHFLKSLWYHPLVGYMTFLYVGYMLSHTLVKLHVPRVRGWKFHNWYIYVGVVLLLVNWIVKYILVYMGFTVLP